QGAVGMFREVDAAAGDGTVEQPTRHVPAATESGGSGSGTLPKRQRREAPPGGFDPPEPVQPSMRPVARREPASRGRQSGSLFEPDAPVASSDDVGDGQVPSGTGRAGGPPAGPFGHGSAMPLPGG